jgi:phosphoglycerate dehydrogenase-like enzyme
MRVVVLDDYQHVAEVMAPWDSLPADVAFVHGPMLSDDALVEAVGNAEIVVAMRERTSFTAARFARLPALRLLVTTGMRNAAIDLDAARASGVLVCGTGSASTPTAEHTWALLLALARHVPDEHQRMREGGWQSTLGFDLAGKTLGLAGLGNLGGQVARVGAAFGMDLVAWSANLAAERCAEVGARLVGREELFRVSDVLTIHLVLSDRTRGLVGDHEFGLMKPSALLVNTSRGPILDSDALVEALQKRRIAGAALDVYDTEPLPEDSPLRSAPNVVLTPHLGYVTENSYRVFYEEAVADIGAWFAGNPTRVLI